MLLPSAIVVSPFVGLVEQNDDHEHRGGRMLLRPAVGATPLLATQPVKIEAPVKIETPGTGESAGKP
jgi:hypothetical protein